MTPTIQSHYRKVKNLEKLCKDHATNPDIDIQVQAYLAKYFIILASAYIEISVKEVITSASISSASPKIARFLAKTISNENSLNCEKIGKILNKFEDGLFEKLRDSMSPEEISAIDSLKNLRDQVAHGKDNGTGYVAISKYFNAIEQFPDKLNKILNANLKI